LLVVLLVRLGNKRFMGKGSAFDMVLAIILGSVASRAITGNAPFIPALAASMALVALHWLFATLAFHLEHVGPLLKGKVRLLVKDGEFQIDALRRSHITENDLLEALRVQTQSTDVHQVKEARLERNGKLSFVLRRSPRVLEIAVAEGVKTVRLELD
jgi:uncharacterized membrane protein YcaP (DUF421 family)